MLGRWKAFVAGESTILDDRGRAVPLYDSSRGELRPKIKESLNLPSTDSLFVEESKIKRAARWIFVGVSTLVPFGFIVYYSWLFSGWVGQKLLGLTGVLASIAGGAVFIGVIVLFSMIALRWENAGRTVRTKRGSRTLDDNLAICELRIEHGVCPACKFSISGLDADDDGFVICPECGAAWHADWWTDYLIKELDQKIVLAKKHRPVACQLDARRQIFEVMAWVDRRDRLQHCGGFWSAFRVRDWLAMLFSLLITGFLVWIVASNASLFSTAPALKIAAIAVVFLIALVAVLQVVRYSRTARFKVFVRKQIDDHKCPHCDHELCEDRHPVDEMIMCPGCWHAWDPATRSRSHHSRRTLNAEDYKRHPAFTKPV